MTTLGLSKHCLCTKVTLACSVLLLPMRQGTPMLPEIKRISSNLEITVAKYKNMFHCAFHTPLSLNLEEHNMNKEDAA